MNKVQKKHNKTALVTGASTGIGQSIAMKLAQNGYKTLLLGRNIKALSQTLNLIRSANGIGKIYKVNLKDKKCINRLIRKIKNVKDLELIINAAGVWHDKNKPFYNTPIEKTSQNQIDNVLSVGIMAPLYIVHGLLPQMKKKRAGKIINISGTFESGGAGWLHYFTSKKALEQFTIGLAQELKSSNIQVNCISPSDTATPAYKKFFPKFSKNALDPEEIAKLALFLASEESRNITGQIIELRKN